MTEIPAWVYLFTLASGLSLALVIGEARFGAPLSQAARLRLFARLVGGRAVLRRSTVGGHVVWTRNEYPFYAYETLMSAQRWTVLAVGWNGMHLPPFNVRVIDGMVPFYSPAQAQTLRTGVPRFEGKFQIRYPPGIAGAPSVSPAVLEEYLALADLCAPQHPFLVVHSNQCRVYLPGALRGRHRRIKTLNVTCRLLDRILSDHVLPPPPRQLLIVDVLLCETGVAPICRICGETVPKDPVYCAKCLTAHHHDCWEYTGMCSTYGCGSKETRARP